jgi:hypothetical protein
MTGATCSRAGWRNPRIHSLDRVKVWLTCDDHAEFLYDYLAGRDFPVVVVPLGTPVLSVPSAAPVSR